jgi:hypothetical protein
MIKNYDCHAGKSTSKISTVFIAASLNPVHSGNEHFIFIMYVFSLLLLSQNS